MSYRKPKYPQKKEKKPAWQGSFSCDDFCMTPYSERSMLTSNITSGLPYQRKVKEARVTELVSTWDAKRNRPLIVSFRDGKFNLIDGQHRIAAMRRMNGGKDCMVHCWVFTGMTYQDEAKLCADIDEDNNKSKMTTSQAVNTQLESGSNPDANAVKKILESYGIEWSLKTRNHRDYRIVAVQAPIASYKALGYQGFSRMIGLIVRSWNGNYDSLTKYMLDGMTLFIKTYAFEIDDDLFKKQMARVDPLEIIRAGNADASTKQSALRHAKVILARYNHKQGKKALPYRFGG